MGKRLEAILAVKKSKRAKAPLPVTKTVSKKAVKKTVKKRVVKKVDLTKLAVIKVSVADIYKILSKAEEKIFYAKYRMRGGHKNIRHMICRISGSKNSSGERIPIHRVLEDVAHEVLTVWDMNRDEYRRINFRDVESLVVDQVEYKVTI